MIEPTLQEKRKIAESIRKALSFGNVHEAGYAYLIPYQVGKQMHYNACAWGLAYIGLFDNPDLAFAAKAEGCREYNGGQGWVVIREALGVSEEYFDKIDNLHKQGKSAGAIADALELNLI